MNRIINYLSNFIHYYFKVVNFDIIENKEDVFVLKNSNSLFTGTAIQYYYEGGIKERIRFKNGLKSGKSFTYYKNGKVREKAIFKKGTLNGIAYLYTEDGNIGARIRYRNGQMI
ncbi:hypothetical protein AS361_17480 [Myroides marinus]|uniref:toxin-antitoxin system YwqK family antitoxin n=1 Tax=Myroides marinus TaxID=703342 RepID=UPI000741C3F1|nr:hypothetical protein [Myroides marinus]KUF41647.1 hypothetical protein AS361_17480 [Myroides marinus]